MRAAPRAAGAPVPRHAAKRVTPTQAEADAVRLLEQATWGPNDALVAHVMSVGAAKFIDEQLALPQTQVHGVRARRREPARHAASTTGRCR